MAGKTKWSRKRAYKEACQVAISPYVDESAIRRCQNRSRVGPIRTTASLQNQLFCRKGAREQVVLVPRSTRTGHQDNLFWPRFGAPFWQNKLFCMLVLVLMGPVLVPFWHPRMALSCT